MKVSEKIKEIITLANRKLGCDLNCSNDTVSVGIYYDVNMDNWQAWVMRPTQEYLDVTPIVYAEELLEVRNELDYRCDTFAFAWNHSLTAALEDLYRNVDNMILPKKVRAIPAYRDL